MLLRLTRVLLLLLVVIVASTGQAATASRAGGQPPVSGVVVSDVQYALATERPDVVVGISFAVAPSDAQRIAVRLHESGEWSSCTRAGGRVDCRLATPLPLAAATELSVSAV
jgi:hypothetical protein